MINGGDGSGCGGGRLNLLCVDLIDLITLITPTALISRRALTLIAPTALITLITLITRRALCRDEPG